MGEGQRRVAAVCCPKRNQLEIRAQPAPALLCRPGVSLASPGPAKAPRAEPGSSRDAFLAEEHQSKLCLSVCLTWDCQNLQRHQTLIFTTVKQEERVLLFFTKHTYRTDTTAQLEFSCDYFFSSPFHESVQEALEGLAPSTSTRFWLRVPAVTDTSRCD